MTHTPGPWHYDKRWACVKTTDNELLLVSGIAMPSGNHPKADEAAANARLIAAAPELLAACEAAINMDWHGIGAPHMYEQLRAAIEKARGD